MLDRLLQKFGAYKIVAPLLAAGIISAPLPAYSKDLFSRDVKQETFSLQEDNSNASLEQRIFPGIALHLETQPRPPYLPPEEPTSSDEKQKAYYINPRKTESGKKPDYLQPQDHYSPSPGYSSGLNGRDHTLGWVCLGVGLAVTAFGFTVGPAKLCENGDCKETRTPQYIVIGGGLGLSILGLWDVLSD